MAEYPKNRWYRAAWCAEVGEALLSRRILGHATLLYRKEDGSTAGK